MDSLFSGRVRLHSELVIQREDDDAHQAGEAVQRTGEAVLQEDEAVHDIEQMRTQST